jgi:hypothetical protein
MLDVSPPTSMASHEAAAPLVNESAPRSVDTDPSTSEHRAPLVGPITPSTQSIPALSLLSHRGGG